MEVIRWIFIILAMGYIVSRFLPAKGVLNITILEAKNRIKEDKAQFVDVRTPGEFKMNHRKPFTNIPLKKLAKRTNELEKRKEVVVICQSGVRSLQAAKILKKQGFEKVTNVKGGMSTWV